MKTAMGPLMFWMFCAVVVLLQPPWAALAEDKVKASVSAPAGDANKENEKRKDLWDSFKQRFPVESSDISVYSENSALTEILFRRHSDISTYSYNLQTQQVTNILHMKAVLRVNRITFNDYGDRTTWVLWYNGEPELVLGG